ncbi:MAG: hypothetical protein DRQ06_03905 [Candidatus Hydrothermota bacterium]|nr:MAG: hypothetical protein DRQ06_03905 [Candidatus Hydrothermae bacterium]
MFPECLLFLSLLSHPLEKVEIRGITSFPESQIEGLLEPYFGSEVDSSLIEKLAAEILDFYGNRGFPFVSVRPEYLRKSREGMTLVLRVEEGKPVVISGLRFVGSEKTKRDVLLRFFRDEGKLFSLARLREEIAEANSSGYVEVLGFSVDTSGGRSDLVIALEEKRVNSADGALLYDQRRKNLGGYLEVGAPNLMGTGRSLALSYRRVSLGEQKFELSYREPWIFGTDFYTEGEIFYHFAESLFIKRSVCARVGLKRKVEFYIGEKYEDNVDMGGNERESNFLSLLGFKAERFSGAYLPRRGISLKSEVQVSGTKQSGFLFAGWRFPGSGRLNLSFRVDLRFVRKKGGEKNFDLITYGGSGSLRGYREGRFLASQVAVAGLEMGYNLTAKSCLSAFVEGGMVKADKARFPVGYGISALLPARSGFLKLSYALSRERDFSEGLIHLSYSLLF